MKHCKCGERLKCLDSRSMKDGSTRRRYECNKCLKKYSTLEVRIESAAHTDSKRELQKILLNEWQEEIKKFTEKVNEYIKNI